MFYLPGSEVEGEKPVSVHLNLNSKINFGNSAELRGSNIVHFLKGGECLNTALRITSYLKIIQAREGAGLKLEIFWSSSIFSYQ